MDYVKIIVKPDKTKVTSVNKTVERKSESPKKTETPTKATNIDEQGESIPLTKQGKCLLWFLKCGISSGSSLFAKELVKGFPVHKEYTKYFQTTHYLLDMKKSSLSQVHLIYMQ